MNAPLPQHPKLARPGTRLTAVLGPTNTGKTYLAVERMLGHQSGMIGFPLRLLARENYDRIVAVKGARAVALVTGEEKILPPEARYFVCTVESMPLDRRVGFLAIDEVQMAADPARGHIFTDRLLHARGLDETMLLGAETARPLIRALVPGIDFINRPRFSTLAYTGPRKITRLPPRSAIVAFSAAEVYRLAELIRRQRGGTGVVLGALSPRARNAQVGMYQAGEVDYLVATDAIGMGLNMDVKHVAFAGLRKFDGRQPRALGAAEIAQIAGRAGRHMSDGTFGSTEEVGAIDPELVERVEGHRFDALKSFYWRNVDLDFQRIDTLLASLERRSPHPCLIRVREGEDHVALGVLARDRAIADLANRPDRVRLLWDVCQIPDFHQTLTDSHTRLLGRIFAFLVEPGGRLPADWMARQLDRLDRTDGDLDALMARIANIRTWTYVAHRPDWVGDPVHWQERGRALEDKLSDALHERLTQRFVDRRAAVLVRRLAGGGELLGAVTKSGEVLVEGEYVGLLAGFRFTPDRVEHGDDTRSLMHAAQRVLRSEIDYRLSRLERADDAAFTLADDGRLLWDDAPVAFLAPGAAILTPRVEAFGSDLLDNEDRQRIRRRLENWLEAHLASHLGSLHGLAKADIRGPARGIAYQLAEALGLVPRRQVRPQVAALGDADRQALGHLGIRIGTESLYMPVLFRGRTARLTLILWRIGATAATGQPVRPPRGLLSFAAEPGVPDSFYAALGYRTLAGRAVRADRLEHLAAELRRRNRLGPFALDGPLAALVGCPRGELSAMVLALGYRAAEGESLFIQVAKRRRPNAPRPALSEPDSPFAKLRARPGMP